MPGSQVLSKDNIRRVIVRMSHEILERNRGTEDVVLIGMHTRGVPLARRIAACLAEFEGTRVPVGALDIGLYRDDAITGIRPILRSTDIPRDISDLRVVIVDDVLFTGRSVRAAMDALTDLGRPKNVQLAILIDRGHRELPIRADYVGKNIPTGFDEIVQVCLEEVDGVDEVLLVRRKP